MGLKRWQIALFLFVFEFSFGQTNTLEMGAVFDNDLYTSTVNDKYYTNGFEFYLRALKSNTSTQKVKTIYEFKLAQKIYNPFTINASNILRNDRPFAGYLFAEVGKNDFYENGTVFKKSYQLGFVGPNAFGEEVQKFFHKSLGYKRIYGWEYQIKNALAVQFSLFHAAPILPKITSQKIDFYFTTDLDLGTVLNGIQFGPLMRISFKEDLIRANQSTLFGGALASNTAYLSQKEFYFYFQPQFNLQLYDATIQGSLFNNNNPTHRDLVPYRLGLNAGFHYRKNHWNVSYAIRYTTREVDYPENTGYYYGSIGLGYFL
jgi:lipid A 3-O-deacylase